MRDVPSRMTVLNVELSRAYAAMLPDGNDLSSALVVCRMQGRVVGRFEAAIENGRLSEEAVQRHLPEIARNAWTRTHEPKRCLGRGLRASIVVCTRDRARDLSRCLASLEPSLAGGHEVVVVDSCPSTDETSQVVSRYPRVRYVLEPRPGQSIARNRGLLAASHEIVAFTDDDAEVEPAWLDALLRNFDDPMTALVTGLTLPRELETRAQIWFERTNGFQRGFKRREFDLTAFDPLAAGTLGAGVNMALRKAVLVETGMFDEALGPGTETQSGDDHEFFYRIVVHGFRAVYDPDAVVWHTHRRDWKALQTVLYGYGVGVLAWWTRALFVERELGVFRVGLGYLRHLARNLIGALLRRPRSMPIDLAYAGLSGALAGPFAYLRAQRRLELERRESLPS